MEKRILILAQSLLKAVGQIFTYNENENLESQIQAFLEKHNIPVNNQNIAIMESIIGYDNRHVKLNATNLEELRFEQQRAQELIKIYRFVPKVLQTSDFLGYIKEKRKEFTQKPQAKT